jgi:DNA-binding protein YbaB
MSSGLPEQLNQLLAQLAEGQEKLKQAREMLEARRATVTSKDHMLSVTVNMRGEVTELKFHTTKYRSMAPAQLATVITQVLADARAQAADFAAATLQPLAPKTVDLRDIHSGNPSLDAALESVTADMAKAREQLKGRS